MERESIPEKDYKRDKDEQGIFLLLSTGQIHNFMGHLSVENVRFVSLLQGSNKLAHVFMVAGWWVTVDFDSQCKIVLGETWAHRVPIREKIKFKNQNLHNYSHPLSYKADACWGGGVTVHCIV